MTPSGQELSFYDTWKRQASRVAAPHVHRATNCAHPRPDQRLVVPTLHGVACDAPLHACASCGAYSGSGRSWWHVPMGDYGEGAGTALTASVQ